MVPVELPPGEDMSAELVERVRAASATGTPLRIVGGGTKGFYGRPVTGDELRVGRHRGVLRYDPAELVITARGGTPLAEIESLLLRHGQRLPFEPPAFGAAATIGGTVAAGLAGPGRIMHGPVRDYVLGATLLTGDGRILRFGGEVMKNVAGFDVSRLLAGSLGILGVLLEVSLKVLPIPAGTLTLRRDSAAAAAIHLLIGACQRGLPVSASFWCEGELHLRLEGSAAALATIAPQFAGDPLAPGTAHDFWQSVREHLHPSLSTALPVWRLALPDARRAGNIPLSGSAFEWHGRQAWVAGLERAGAEAMASNCGGHATLFRHGPDAGSQAADEVFPPLTPAVLQVHRAVKRVFDPAGILNPGRMYADL